ncbi:HAMP domain-containing sensor histidine kinase [Alteribacter lacisalsi]|nr:HAMP domain-containing sensor histidine kinase [Alteribacter lacisalsi]
MIKSSLYGRTVLTFIGTIMVSLIAAYVLTPFLTPQEVVFEEEVVTLAETVTDIISLADEEDITALLAVLENVGINGAVISGEELDYGTNPGLTAEEQEQAAEVAMSGTETMVLPFGITDVSRTVVVPLGEETAVIVHVDYEAEVRQGRRTTLFTLLIVLVTGSTLTLLASRQIVFPIRKLSLAARKMAGGDFSIRLKSRRKDEMGELIDSFNDMAAEVGKIDTMREDFVSNLSHEIQSPLTSIKGFTKAVRDEVIPKEEQTEYLEIVYREADRLSKLSENLLRLASLDSEHHPLEQNTFRLDEQLRRLTVNLEPLWAERNIQINLDLNRMLVTADEELLEHVWINLITNAVKFSSEEGRVDIAGEQKGAEFIILVRDFGEGIPEQDLPYLFDRFYKGTRSPSAQKGGSGLGLAITKRIVDLHGGTIQISSTVNEGTEVEVRLSAPSLTS